MNFCKSIFCALGLALGLPAGHAETNSTGPLQRQFEQIAPAAKGRVGVAALLLETGETAGLNAHERFPMQSVYKVLIGMAVLHQVDLGRLKLDQTIHVGTNDFVPPPGYSFIRDEHPTGAEISVRELLRAMVAGSDGTACDVFLRLLGGARQVQDYLLSLGITNITVATTEAEMGRDEQVQYRNWAFPDAMVAVLRHLYEGKDLSESSRALLLQWMTETTVFPGRIKGLLPAGTVVAHKTGSSRTVNGLARTTNDVGLITLPDGRHFAIAVFVSDSTVDMAAREAVIAKIARAAWDYWTAAKGKQG
jgi:beta-lactamase class A